MEQGRETLVVVRAIESKSTHGTQWKQSVNATLYENRSGGEVSDTEEGSCCQCVFASVMVLQSSVSYVSLGFAD